MILNVVPRGLFYYHPSLLWKFPPEIWRPVASFIPTDPGLSLLFDTYFLYHYMSQLEKGHPRFPRNADLVWYLMFVSGSILVSFGRLPLCSFVLEALALEHLILSARIVPCLLSITVPRNEEEYPCTSDWPIIRKIRVNLRCRHGGIVKWMARVIPIHSSGFLTPYISSSQC